MLNTKFIFLPIALAFGLNNFAQDDQDSTKTWNDDKSNGGFSEKLTKVLGAKIEEINAKKNASVDAEVKESLAKITDKWPSNNKLVTYVPYGSSNMLKGGSYVYIEFERNEENIVHKLNISFNLNEDKTLKDPKSYEADIHWMYTDNPWFFPYPMIKAYGGNTLDKIYVTENSIVMYEVEKYDEVEINDIVWIAGKKGKNRTTWGKEVEAHRRWGFAQREIDEKKLKTAELDYRTKHSLENKEVTDIKVIYTDDTETQNPRAGSLIKFGIQATLADGTVDKTHNLGGNLYMEDFVIDFNGEKGITEKYKTDEFGGHPHKAGFSLLVSSRCPKPGERDIIDISVKPKYEGKGEYQKVFPIMYNSEIAISRAAQGTIKIEVKKVKHSETGEELLFCKYGNDYKKLKSGGTISCNQDGSNGSTGYNGSDCSNAFCKAGRAGDGGDGHDGKNILLITTADAKHLYKTNFSVQGGRGGMPGIPGTAWSDSGYDGDPGYRGMNGLAGNIKITTGKVSF